jgi:hypothetical protein
VAQRSSWVGAGMWARVRALVALRRIPSTEDTHGVEVVGEVESWLGSMVVQQLGRSWSEVNRCEYAVI